MRSILILTIFVFVFASCHNDVPELTDPKDVVHKWCGYENKDGKSECKSTYEVSEAWCRSINGEFFSDSRCKVPYEEEPKEPEE